MFELCYDMDVISSSSLILLVIAVIQTPSVFSSEAYWAWDGSVSRDVLLTSHVIRDVYNVHVISQCARECFYESVCVSFNFNFVTGHCQLNSATVELASDDVIAVNGTVYVDKTDIAADEVSVRRGDGEDR